MTVKPAVVSGVILLAFAGYFGYHTVYLDSHRKIKKLQEQLTEQRRTQELRVEVARSLQAIGRLRERLPAEPETEWLVREVSKRAEEATLLLKAITPDVPKRLPDVTPVTVSFQFTASYSQLVNFLQALEQADVFMRVDDLDIGRSRQGVSPIRLTVSTLYLSPLEEAAAPSAVP